MAKKEKKEPQNEPYGCRVETPFGVLTVFSDGDYMTRSTWRDVPCSGLTCSLLDEAVAQIRDYLSGHRRCFFLPLRPAEKLHAQWARAAMLGIPYGKTDSYWAIGERIRRAGATAGVSSCAQAVSGACEGNPLTLLVPCHRVLSVEEQKRYLSKNPEIPKEGESGGYAGGNSKAHKSLKKKLWDLEQRYATTA